MKRKGIIIWIIGRGWSDVYEWGSTIPNRENILSITSRNIQCECGKSDSSRRCIKDGGGKKPETCRCIVGRKGRKVDGGWEGETVVEVIECPKRIKLK